MEINLLYFGSPPNIGRSLALALMVFLYRLIGVML